MCKVIVPKINESLSRKTTVFHELFALPFAIKAVEIHVHVQMNKSTAPLNTLYLARTVGHLLLLAHNLTTMDDFMNFQCMLYCNENSWGSAMETAWALRGECKWQMVLHEIQILLGSARGKATHFTWVICFIEELQRTKQQNTHNCTTCWERINSRLNFWVAS